MAFGAFSTRLSQRLPALVWRVMLAAPLLTLIVPTSTAARQAESFAFSLELVADGFEQPVQVVDPGDDSGRLFVVEQTGRIRVLRDGQINASPFLDISDRVGCCGERGLLSMAFHPDFATNGMFFANYTDVNGDTVVARYHVVADDPDRGDAASAETIFTVDQPAANHNGGLLMFGPNDGYLYVGLGDGGGGNGQNGQDLSTLLGKILRIDVDSPAGDLPYGIPPDNPFVDQPGARPEIWLFGVRNPWRFSFDRASGDLWIGDVGSVIYEEINRQPASSTGGENYGWDLMEGPECRAEDGCDAFVAPVSGFPRGEGCVVTGGYVYRGAAVPELEGTYLFADYCGGKVWGLAQDTGGAWIRLGPVETGLRISSFGEDASGELYVVDLQGAVHRIRAAEQTTRCGMRMIAAAVAERPSPRPLSLCAGRGALGRPTGATTAFVFTRSPYEHRTGHPVQTTRPKIATGIEGERRERRVPSPHHSARP